MEKFKVNLHRGSYGLGCCFIREKPCILENVINGGVADRAGLKNRDEVIEMNEQNVRNATHSQIVDILAQPTDFLTLTVERLPSTTDCMTESSVDSDSQIRYEQRLRLESRMNARRSADKNNAGLSRGAELRSKRTTRNSCRSLWQIDCCDRSTVFDTVVSKSSYRGRPSEIKARQREASTGRRNRCQSDPDLADHLADEFNGISNHYESDSSDTERGHEDSDDTMEESLLLFKCVLVYVGGVPVTNLNKARRSIIKSAITNLRAQKAKARTVLMEIYTEEVIVSNGKGEVTQRFRSSDIAFAAPCVENKQFFGLVMSINNSKSRDLICHMFATDPQLHLHSFHYNWANKFKIKCSKDPDNSFCMEFPPVSTPVLCYLSYLWRIPQKSSLDPVSCVATKNRCVASRPDASSNGSDSGIAEVRSDTQPKKMTQKYAPTRTVAAAIPRMEANLRAIEIYQQQDQDVAKPGGVLSGVDSHSSVESFVETTKVGHGSVPMKQQSCDLSGIPQLMSSSSMVRTQSQQDGLESDRCVRKLSTSQPDFSRGRAQTSSADCSALQSVSVIAPILSRSSDQMLAASTGADVERILQNPDQRKPFQYFLEQQFCSENLNFYLAVQEFKKVSDQRRTEMAKSIYERHFMPNSVEPVNIDNATAKTIKEAVTSDSVTLGLYDVAQYQIFHLLKYDCWPRFIQWQAKFPSQAKQFNAKMEPRSGTLSSTASADLNASTGSLAHAEKREHKRKSMLWQGLRPRFSRRKKETPVTIAKQTVNATVDASTSREETRDKQPVAISSTGSRRRQGFTTAGKQYSVPAEFSYSPQIPATSGLLSRADGGSEKIAPNISHSSSEVQQRQRFCTFLTPDGDLESVVLRDPSESVSKWTFRMAELHGLSVATEAVDAQTGALIDPARQAQDALHDRSVRLDMAVIFRLELIPSVSTSSALSTDKKLVAVKAKQGASTDSVLRPVLTKYGLDLDNMVVCMAETTEVLPHSTAIDKADKRKLMVMSQTEFQEWLNNASRMEIQSPLDHSPTSDFGFPFHPIGDVCVAELPIDFYAMSRPKQSAVRSLSSRSKSDHSSAIGGMLKFVRKASNTSKEEEASVDRYSVQLRRKSLGTFRGAVSAALKAGDTSLIHGCPDANTLMVKRQAITNPTELKSRLQQEKILAELMCKAQSSRIDDQRGTSPGCYELPDFLKTSAASGERIFGTQVENRSVVESEQSRSNGQAQKLQRIGPIPPPLYASSVRSDVTTPTEAELTSSWQVDYV